MEDKIIELVVGKEEVTWKSMLLDLVRAEGMDPWNVNITLLTQKYLEMLKKLKDLDFRVSGKMVLAAAILLRLKTSRLVGEDMMELDRLMRPQEELSEDEFYGELESGNAGPEQVEYPQLFPRTPQPRKRKVSIYDLMNALNKALEVKERRVLRSLPLTSIRMPEKKYDISKLIASVYDRIRELFSREHRVTFSQVISRPEDRVLTFISLLHLANQDQRKVDLVQKEPFGEIEIILREDSPGQNLAAPTAQPPAQ